jgi:hypothetical protein
LVKNWAVLGSKHGTIELSSFSFIQFWAARNGNIIPAECVAEFFGNQPKKHRRYLEIIG